MKLILRRCRWAAIDAERVLDLDGSSGIGVGGIDGVGGDVVAAGERGGVFDVGGDSGVAARVCSFVFTVGAAGGVAGTAGSATLSLEGAYGLLSEESVTVSLSVAGADVEGILVSPVEVSFDKVSTSVEVDVGVLSSVVAATTRLLASVSSKPAWVAVSDTALPVAFSRAFRLAFLDLSGDEATARLSVAKGESLAFGLSLLGAELGEGESLEVRLGVSPEGAGASLVGGETLRFVQGMQSATTSVSVTRDSSLSAFSVSPLGTTPSLVVMNASFTTATSLNVDVLERRVYSLAFEPSAVEVVANSSLGLRLSLVGADDLPSGEEVLVSLGVSGGKRVVPVHVSGVFRFGFDVGRGEAGCLGFGCGGLR